MSDKVPDYLKHAFPLVRRIWLKNISNNEKIKPNFLPIEIDRDKIKRMTDSGLGSSVMSYFSIGYEAESIKIECSFKKRLKLIPYIIKIAFKTGWGPGEMRKIWKYEERAIPIRGGLKGFNILGVGA